MKNNITIVCDSSVDLTAEFMRERNIEFLSLLVDLNGHVYKDKVDLSNKEFYEAIKHKVEIRLFVLLVLANYLVQIAQLI